MTFNCAGKDMGLIATNIKGVIKAKVRTKVEDQAIGERISCYLVMQELSQQGNSCKERRV
jgi:hypothetical protein